MTESETPTDRGWLARLTASRRWRVLLAVGVILLAVRAILPSVLRPLLIARADEALVGFVEIGDLDLSILRGGVTLHDVSVHVDERPGEAPPLFTARRLWTQISWLALLARTIEVEALAIDDFAVHLDRFEDGLRLPRLVPASDPAPEPPPPDASTPRWSLAADSIALRDGRIELVDHTLSRAPQIFALALEDLTARELNVHSEQEDRHDEEPGRIAIEAKLEQGTLSLSAWVEPYDDGLDVRSTLVLDEIPIDKLRAYVTAFGWSTLTGRLDARIDHHYASRGIHELSGEANLADLRIDVAGQPDPALAWKGLEVVVDRVDLAERHAEVARITSTGVALIVDPRADPPLPLLRPAAPGAAPAPEAATASGSIVRTEDSEASPPPSPRENDDALPPDDAPGWTWRVGKTEIRDAVIDLRGGREPVRLAVDGELGRLAGERASRAPLALRLTTDAGGVTLEGELAPMPLAFDGRLVVRALALPPLLAQVDLPGGHWLRSGALRADLQLALAEDLRAAGTLGLAVVALEEPSTKDRFRVAWQDLDVRLRRLDLRHLRAPSDPVPTRPPARALDVALAHLALASPRVVLTRDAEGLVLPPLDAPSPDASVGEPARAVASASGGNETESSAEDQTGASALPLAISVGDARIRDGRVQLVDRALEPEYRGRIRAIELHAQGARWPGNAVDALALTAEGLRGARLELNGALEPDEKTRLDFRLVELPLEQFKAYVASTGYALSGGALSLDSKIELGPEKLTSRNRIVVASLGIAGVEGEAAFLRNFGMPLSVALALLEDLDGKITLAVPIAGEPENMKVGLGGLIAQALRKALIGALSAPLKLLGAVTRKGEIADPSPAPVDFIVGEDRLADDEDDHVGEIAALLASSPAIALRLAGQTAASDDRMLCERALLDQLEASRGVRALSAFGEMARRRAVREFLAERLAGGRPEPLAGDDARWLEAQLARARAPIEALEALATARAERLRDRLVETYEIDATRLILDVPRIDPPAPAPSVAIEIEADFEPESAG
ncbi:MAG: DUF748 domain-containing protein [Myxococcota bacterium]